MMTDESWRRKRCRLTGMVVRDEYRSRMLIGGYFRGSGELWFLLNRKFLWFSIDHAESRIACSPWWLKIANAPFALREEPRYDYATFWSTERDNDLSNWIRRERIDCANNRVFEYIYRRENKTLFTWNQKMFVEVLVRVWEWAVAYYTRYSRHSATFAEQTTFVWIYNCNMESTRFILTLFLEEKNE